MATRAASTRPEVVLFDVFETLLQLAPMADRFAAAGRPAAEFDLFFARVLRDGMAFTLAGAAPAFAELAKVLLRITSFLSVY
ncbi:MAG: hypothetical protein ACRDRL_01760 [Sciscionella sp.]